MANQIDSSIPQNSESPTLGAQRIREFKADVNTLVGKEHDISDDGATQGFHGEQITVKASASIDDPPALYGRLGAITADGSTDLHYKDDANTVTQLTRGGKVNLDKNIIANDTPLQADNAAGDGLVDLIKAGRNEADDANVMIVSDGTRTDTNAAPLEDTGVANKKYVDDTIATATAFGSLVNRSEATPYIAATDGFIMASANSAFFKITVGGIDFRTQSDTGSANEATITVSVAAGETYQVTDLGSSIFNAIKWRPASS